MGRPWLPNNWSAQTCELFALNQTLKNQPTKLVLETRLPWVKCLPIAPYEMFNGLPYLSSVTDVPTFETKDCFLKNYTQLSSTLLCLKAKRLLAQAPPLDFPFTHTSLAIMCWSRPRKKISLSQRGKDPSWSCWPWKQPSGSQRGVDSSHTSKEGAPHLTRRNNGPCSHIQETPE
jgi:hypothetical protein